MLNVLRDLPAHGAADLCEAQRWVENPHILLTLLVPTRGCFRFNGDFAETVFELVGNQFLQVRKKRPVFHTYKLGRASYTFRRIQLLD